MTIFDDFYGVICKTTLFLTTQTRTKSSYSSRSDTEDSKCLGLLTLRALEARMMGGGEFVDEAREQADADRTKAL